MPGAITGRMLDLGYFKLPLAIASAVLVVCAFLVAECKEYWQFLLCQGIGMGVCALPASFYAGALLNEFIYHSLHAVLFFPRC
jgi:hypothetical protein